MSLLNIIKKGSVNRSITLRIIDATDGTPETGVVFNTSGIDLWYRREGAAVTSITEVTLAALTTVHTDGVFLHISNGVYRFDIPDAAFSTAANLVEFGGTVTGMVVIGGEIKLVDYDPEDTVRMGLTALPDAAADAAGGLPISDAGGLDLDAMNVNINEIESDVAAGVIASGTAQSATGTTLVLASATSFADDLVIGATVVITGGSAGVGQSRTIVDWVNTTDTATVDAWTVTPTGTITYTVFATPPASATNVPPVDIAYINGVAVIGDGSGTPWGP
tara:strand:+ start:440 stop:1270 length:831 start_codon:yes stop_codon:yes gene_type:complete